MKLYTIKYRYQIAEDTDLIDSEINFIDGEPVDITNLMIYLTSLYNPNLVYFLEILEIIKLDEQI